MLTYVNKLAKATGDARFVEWYDWLFDAAHPAFEARIALSTPPMQHDSGAVILRMYARTPMLLHDESGATVPMDNVVAHNACDALIASGRVMWNLQEDALMLVDDFGLTTSAATLTKRELLAELQAGSWKSCVPVRSREIGGVRPSLGGRAPKLRIPAPTARNAKYIRAQFRQFAASPSQQSGCRLALAIMEMRACYSARSVLRVSFSDVYLTLPNGGMTPSS